MTILTGKARLAGITGWPVGHSRSPRLHGFWLDRYGIDGAYVPLPIEPAHFAEAIRGLLRAGFAGVNCTIPHKVAAFAVCDVVDETAHRAGAVNTLVFQDGRITGTNTDGWGFLENLRANGVDPAAGPALILGAGGAARAIVAVLLGLGVTRDAGQPHARSAPMHWRGICPGCTSSTGSTATPHWRTTRCWLTRPRWDGGQCAAADRSRSRSVRH